LATSTSRVRARKSAITTSSSSVERAVTATLSWPIGLDQVGSWIRVRKKSSICRIAAMKFSKSTGLLT